MPGSGVLDVRQWRAKVTGGQAKDGVTPPEIADALENAADKTFAALAALRTRSSFQTTSEEGQAQPVPRTPQIEPASGGLETPATKPADAELAKTLDDCEALAWLARYYAAKIRGAYSLALFDLSSDGNERDAAVQHLEAALANWRRYAAVRDGHYVPALYNRLGYVDITALTEKVAADVEMARQWKPGSVREAPRGSETEKGFKL